MDKHDTARVTNVDEECAAAFRCGWYDARPDDGDRYAGLTTVSMLRKTPQRYAREYWHGHEERNRG